MSERYLDEWTDSLCSQNIEGINVMCVFVGFTLIKRYTCIGIMHIYMKVSCLILVVPQCLTIK